MIEAAIAAGADTAYLSGSGPTVAAITSGAAGDIFLQRTKERVDKQVNFWLNTGVGYLNEMYCTGWRCRPTPLSMRRSLAQTQHSVSVFVFLPSRSSG